MAIAATKVRLWKVAASLSVIAAAVSPFASDSWHLPTSEYRTTVLSQQEWEQEQRQYEEMRQRTKGCTDFEHPLGYIDEYFCIYKPQRVRKEIVDTTFRYIFINLFVAIGSLVITFLTIMAFPTGL